MEVTVGKVQKFVREEEEEEEQKEEKKEKEKKIQLNGVLHRKFLRDPDTPIICFLILALVTKKCLDY